ncbi:ATP-binding protein [Eionea flava]
MILSRFISIRQKFQGLSGKLMALFAMIAVLFVLIIGIGLNHFYKDYFKQKVRPYLGKYLEYVRQDIGIPADYVKAAALAEKLNMTIMIVDPRGRWSSDVRIQPIDPREIEQRFRRKGVRYGHAEIEGTDYLVMTSAKTTFFFGLGHFKHERKHPRIIVPLILLLAVLLLLYYATHKLFHPILVIKEGVREIGAGNLAYRIDVKRHDELGVLAADVNAMAEQLEKILDAKRQLLLAVSHELRTPLTRANVAIEMLDDSALKKQLKQDIGEVGDLVSEILETERLSNNHQALDKIDTDFVELCREVVDTLSAKNADHAQSLRCDFSSASIMLSVDKTRIKLLLKNILSNALRYKKQQVLLSVFVQDGHVIAQISDDGEGIANDVVEHLTEPFYRVDPARQRQTGGYGLGLYLCKVIAEAHGGQLVISSQEGVGTDVRVTLPCALPSSSALGER